MIGPSFDALHSLDPRKTFVANGSSILLRNHLLKFPPIEGILIDAFELTLRTKWSRATNGSVVTDTTIVLSDSWNNRFEVSC